MLFSRGLAPFMALSSKSVIQGSLLCCWSVIQTERMGPDFLAPRCTQLCLLPPAQPSLAGCCSASSFQATGWSMKQEFLRYYTRNKTSPLSHMQKKVQEGLFYMGRMHEYIVKPTNLIQGLFTFNLFPEMVNNEVFHGPWPCSLF